MDASRAESDDLIRSAAKRLRGHKRRQYQAEVTTRLCDGNPRLAERRFGWGRDTIAKGLHEARSGLRCVENFAVRGKRRCEDEDPQLAAHIRAIVEPHTQADPELKSERRYSNLSAEEVLDALKSKYGYRDDRLPHERTMRDILNRMNYRLRRIQKAKPLKKTKQTNAIFANLKAVREEYKNDAETLEISIDTKAKVNEGDYSRGGKNPDRLGREESTRLGPRPTAGTQVGAVRYPGVGDWGIDCFLRQSRDERFLGRLSEEVVDDGERGLRTHQAAGNLPRQRAEELRKPDAVPQTDDRVL